MIKIRRLELIDFGRLSDTVIEATDGFNLIYGSNEAGKSTIQLFIRTMLYGIPKRGGKKEVKDRERIIPWGKPRAAGRMLLHTDNADIEIYREFGKRASSDRMRVLNAVTGEEYKGIESENVGLHLLGMSAGMFERTVWIAQGAVPSLGGNDELAGRLAKLLDGGGDVTAADALDRLHRKALAIKARDRRSAPGELDRLASRRRDLLDRRAETERLLRSAEQRRNRAEELRREIPSLIGEEERLKALERSEHARNSLERVERLDSCAAQIKNIRENEIFQLFESKIKAGAEDTLRAAARASAESRHALDMAAELDAQEAERRENERIAAALRRRTALIAATAVTVLFFCIALAVGRAAVWIGCAVVSAACWLAAVAATRKTDVSAPEPHYDEAQRRAREAEQSLADALLDFDCRSMEEFEEKYRLYSEKRNELQVNREVYDSLLRGDSYEELCRAAEELRSAVRPERISRQELSRRLDYLQRRRTAAERDLAAAEVRLENVPEAAEIFDIDDDIKIIDDRSKELTDEYDACLMAQRCISEVYDSIRSDYTPALNRRTEEYLSELTDGGLTSVRVAGDFSVSLNERGDRADPKRAELFSTGAYNQIYLALRLASASLTMRPEDTVLFLDDALTAFDDERAQRAQRLLLRLCRDGAQTLMFTCHNRDVLNAKKIGEINIMEV